MIIQYVGYLAVSFETVISFKTICTLPRGAMYKLSDTPQHVGAIGIQWDQFHHGNRKKSFRGKFRNRITWIGHFSSVEVNGPVRTTYTRLALFFASTWWDTTRWSVSQRCMRWQKYLTTNGIVPEASFSPEIATSFAGSASDPAATLWKVSVATRCLFDQSLPIAGHESLNRESQLLCIIQNVSDSAWYFMKVRRSGEKHHHLRKMLRSPIIVSVYTYTYIHTYT